MIRNRTIQLIYQTAFCTLGLLGVVASLGFFEMDFRWDFYIMYTNLSGYFCVIVSLMELYETARKHEDGYVTAHPLLKFIGMLGILLTFMVFNLMLAHAPGRNPADNYKIASVLLHVVLPVTYILYVFIHAAIHHFDTSVMNYLGSEPLIYPYFFLNPEKAGVTGVVKWCLALVLLFVIAGFIFMGIDRLIKRLQARVKTEWM